MAANAGFLQSQDLAVVRLNDSAETTAKQLAEMREVNLFSRYAEDHLFPELEEGGIQRWTVSLHFLLAWWCKNPKFQATEALLC